ncbi:MAG: RNA polymerase sigma factor [Myxococcales bacterium]
MLQVVPASMVFALGSARFGGLVSGLVGSSEDEWVRRAQRGEPEALAWLVRTHGPRLQRLFLRVFGPRADLEDLVQNTFLELLHALPGFRHESTFSTFLTGIAVRVGRRALRPSRVVQLAVDVSRADGVEHAASGPDEKARASELLRRVHQLLAEVAEPKRVAFLLWAVEGLPPSEVADAMQASLSATRSRIFYAQKELLAAARQDPYLCEWLEEHRP